MSSIQMEFRQYILCHTTNLLSHGRKSGRDFGSEVMRKSKFKKNVKKKTKKRKLLNTVLPNFSYSNSYCFLTLLYHHYLLLISLLPTYFSLVGNATEPTIFQHFSTYFSIQVPERSKIIRKQFAKVPIYLFYELFRVKWVKEIFFKNSKTLLVYKKKDVNRDSHIASSPISQSSFFKGARCLILASSQRKLRGYIEFL